MLSEALIFPHVGAGVIGIVAAAVLMAETMVSSQPRISRVRLIAWFIAFNIWLSFLFGGFWYLNGYGASKEIILDGEWPWAHQVVMEAKEHLFLVVLLGASLLPIIAEDCARNNYALPRRLIAVLAANVLFLGLLMELFGGVISMAVRVGLAR